VLAGGVPMSPEHVVSARVAADADVPVCNADPDWGGSEPKPVVPSPVVPRPLVPRAVTPRFFVFGELLAVVGVELPDDVDEGNEEEFALGAVMAAEFGALMTPELLTELHGADVLLSAPRPAGIPEVAKLVVGLSPPLVGLSAPPSKVDNAAAPEPPLVQGAALPTPPNGAGVVWELLPGGWPKSAPSGDVAPMPPGLDVPICELPEDWPKSAPSGDVTPTASGLAVPVCAALWQTPNTGMASRTTAAQKDFIWMTIR
jgi:hypothetical protein